MAPLLEGVAGSKQCCSCCKKNRIHGPDVPQPSASPLLVTLSVMAPTPLAALPPFCHGCRPAGLPVNDARPDHKLPYGGRWLWAGSGMIHLMELPSPDPTTGRPKHGGHDKHACIQVQDVEPLRAALDRAGTRSLRCIIMYAWPGLAHRA